MNVRSKGMMKSIFIAIACFVLCFIIVFGVTACGSEGAQGPKGDTGAAGADGTNGTNGTTPHIGSNGNWWFGDTDSGISATGPAGEDGSAGKDGSTGSTGGGTILAPDYYRATYVKAPYTLKYGQKIDDEVLEPVFFENEDHNGPRIGVTMLGVLKIQGSTLLGDVANEPMYFRDINNNKLLDIFEDWRLPAEIRAQAMATTLSDVQLTYNLRNENNLNPGQGSNINNCLTDGKPDWKKVMGNTFTVETLNQRNLRAGVNRSMPSNTQCAVWWNNALEQYSEWHAIENDESAVPFMVFTNPSGQAQPSSPGATAAVLGDGNADLVYQDAQINGAIMWARGIDGIYGPQIDLVTDPRWSRNSTTYGEREDVAAAISRAITMGYQNGSNGMVRPTADANGNVRGSVLLTIKHFPGDSASYLGFESHGAIGRYRLYETENSFANYHLKPFIAGMEAGAAGVMTSYSQATIDARYAPQSITYNGETHDILYDAFGSAFDGNIKGLLRDVLQFEGLINSDSIFADNEFGVDDTGLNLSAIERTVLFAKNTNSGLRNNVSQIAMGEQLMEALDTGLITRADLREAAYYRLKPRAQNGDLDNPYRNFAESDAIISGLSDANTALQAEMRLKSVVLMKNKIRAGGGSTPTLPLLAADKTKKIYARSYGTGDTSSNISGGIRNELTALGYTEQVTEVGQADIAYLRLSPASPTNGSGKNSKALWVPDLGSFTSPMFDYMAQPTGSNGTVTSIHATALAEFQATATAIRAAGGIVIGEIPYSNAYVYTQFEPYCDAIIGVSSSGDASIAKILAGTARPTGKLPISMISHLDAVKVTPKTYNAGTEDEETWMMSASPSDVPGYAKDLYIDPTVKASLPNNSYVYKDSEGNFYVSGFGLTYP